jgi:hypothetical protein
MNIYEMELSLQSNIMKASFVLRINIYPILSSTEKTYTVKRAASKHRVSVSEFFKINKLHASETSFEKIRYITWCLETDFEEAVKKLEKAFYEDFERTKNIQENAIKAVANSYIVQKFKTE